jgi:hypothetical protein
MEIVRSSVGPQVSGEMRRRIRDMGLMRATDSQSVVVRWVARFVVIGATWIMIGGIGLFLLLRFDGR